MGGGGGGGMHEKRWGGKGGGGRGNGHTPSGHASKNAWGNTRDFFCRRSSSTPFTVAVVSFAQAPPATTAASRRVTSSGRPRQPAREMREGRGIGPDSGAGTSRVSPGGMVPLTTRRTRAGEPLPPPAPLPPLPALGGGVIELISRTGHGNPTAACQPATASGTASGSGSGGGNFHCQLMRRKGALELLSCGQNTASCITKLSASS